MRIIDENKILRVKSEAKKMIVEKGYHGATILEIAKRANVSDGYLYRHHKNKAEFVKDILEMQLKEFHDYVFQLLETKKTAKELVKDVITYLFKLFQDDPYAIAFSNVLIYEFDFEYPESRSQAIDQFSHDILVLGQKTGEFSQKIRDIDVQTTIFTIPVKFIEYRSKGYIMDEKSDAEEINLLLNICMNALK